MTKYIRMAELASRPGKPGRLPAARNTIWRWAAEGKFPKPVRLGPGITAFVLAEVEAWERSRQGGEA